jgi:tRNA-specific 2-thiouridylase
VAKHLELPYPIHHVSFQAEYWNGVFEPYLEQLTKSTTPNPDVDCNRYIKFGVLKDYLKERFQDDSVILATGHYARLWDRSIPDNDDDDNNNNNNDDDDDICSNNRKMPDYLHKAFLQLRQNGSDCSSSWLIDYILDPSVAEYPVLMSARDRSKDQSYFLSRVPAKAFSNVLFPLGDLFKNVKTASPAAATTTITSSSVRELAQEAKLPNATKKESMGICFVGKRKHGTFVNDFIPDNINNNGNATTTIIQCINVEDQTVIATLDGSDNTNFSSLRYATIGQGAKLSGAALKWFVVDKQITILEDIDDNSNNTTTMRIQLQVCPGTHHPALYSDTLYIQDFHWMMGGQPPPLPCKGVKCRIRHLQPLVDCEIEQENPSFYRIRLSAPLRGIAPGQVCAIYAGGKEGDLVCLGGGIIDRRGPSYWERQQELPQMIHPAGHNDLSIPRKQQAS